MKLLEFIRKNIVVIIAVLIIIGVLSYTGIKRYLGTRGIYVSRANDEYTMIPKTYKVNEYANVNISTDTVIRIYFSDFKNTVGYAIDDAYSKLDKEYRDKNFPTIESFQNYLKSINFENSRVEKYSIDSSTYTIYDNFDNIYIFEVEGVLQYKVYFDKYIEE